MLRLLALVIATTAPLGAQTDLRLPTANQHLFSDNPEQFYMHVDRMFEGKASKPWTGGCYGYVRNCRRIDEHRVIHTRFHEGIDIKPLKRDRYNRALDKVNSIAAGKVVYTNKISGHSNYGRYVVVEHRWENSSIYSLYAHLATVTCREGQKVEAGTELGVMGYSGRGLNRARSHLHLELNMMLSKRFGDWAKGMVNHHGQYNGINMTGCDVARFYLEHRKNPDIKFSDFIASTPVHFKVLAPGSEPPDFVMRHPWICQGNPEGAKSWEISFSATGLPVAFTPSTREVEQPIVTAIRPSDIPHQYLTRNLISGLHNRATLNTNGQKLVALLMDEF